MAVGSPLSVPDDTAPLGASASAGFEALDDGNRGMSTVRGIGVSCPPGTAAGMLGCWPAWVLPDWPGELEEGDELPEEPLELLGLLELLELLELDSELLELEDELSELEEDELEVEVELDGLLGLGGGGELDGG